MNPFKQLNRRLDEKFANQLRVATAMFNCFLSIQFELGDAFLKSSKDFIK
ncbi:hypothetical protein Phep_1835 [Pedobacter heparinus DSM 2366]|uniref:Uncharacterized protein n=1 Tax=Pedobacter heparinus (strain ATCC 13125 / DSM 2366 / CIP 104194 / JCM 7457 / NBRC 12017 / NCIMB 9290 / NRRL B-14731 / HIM 762-3) TaxID=485917 RepID=C6XVH7_PEDHD|nr:hypothetical protein Phep_1835 [Pedobacter heparinus DSM 2366]